VKGLLLLSSDLEEVVTVSEENLRKLDGTTIVILGGTGFVGKWLVSTLISARLKLSLNYEIYVVTRSSLSAREYFNPSDVRLIEHDLAAGCLDLPIANYFVHGATPSVPSTGSQNPFQVMSATTNGTISISNAVEKSPSPKSCLYLSSGAVYGSQSKDLIRQPESVIDVLNESLNSYGRTKLSNELMMAQIKENFGVAVSLPRLFAFYGPHIALDAHFAIGNFLRDARAGRPVRILGNPNTTRSYMYPTDLIINLIQLLVNPEDRPINLGSPQPLTMRSVAEKICKMFGGIQIEEIDPDSTFSNYVPQTDWILGKSGIEPRVSFNEGLHRWNRWLDLRL
jgi:nucleoside-diphosphate-sugar epimerase